MKRTLKGFTLSEVMLVLSVIGVIAALTIPGIMQNTQNKQTVARVKKEYSTLSQAFTSIVADNDAIQSADWSTDATALKLFTDKLNVLKTCAKGAATGAANCLATPATKGSFAEAVALKDADYGGAVLADGTQMLLRPYGTGCAGTYTDPTASAVTTGGNVCADIIVDINGAGTPNVLGRDQFVFYVTRNGVEPAGVNDAHKTDCNSTDKKSVGCANAILSTNNVAY